MNQRAAVALMLLSIGLAGCIGQSSPAQMGWLETAPGEADFIQWTNTNGVLKGEWSATMITSGALQSQSLGFTGSLNGSAISITFTAFGAQVNYVGSLTGNTLSLTGPDQDNQVVTQVFHAATLQDYQGAVAALQRQLNLQQAAAATATAQAAAAQATASAQAMLDQAVTHANATLAADLQTLSNDTDTLKQDTSFDSDLQSYSRDWSQMQADYQHEQADYRQGCGQYGDNAATVSDDAASVSDDLASITDDDASLTDTLDSVNTDITQIRQDIQSVQTDWQKLQAAVNADDTPDPVAAQFSESDVASAVTTAQNQLASTDNAIKQAQAQARQYDQEAASLNQQAQNLANSMRC